MFKPGNADVVRTGDLAAAQTAAFQAQTASLSAATARDAATAQRVLAETAAGQAQASASAASASQAGAASAVAAGLAGRTLTAGTGLTGGGNLGADRTFAFDQSWGDNRYAGLNGGSAFVFSCAPATLGVHALNRDTGDGRYALLTGGAFTGQVSVNTPAGTGAFYGANTGLTARWAWGRDGTAESGLNVGSNWALFRYADNGSLISAPITVNRATGAATFEVAPSVGSNAVWHAGTFNPATKANLAGDTFTGAVSFNAAVSFSLNPSVAGFENWNGGNFGRPLTSAGIGQWQALTTATGAAAVLPAGGTWACAILQFNASTGAHTGGAAATVAAGGSTVASAFAGLIWNGFCWRIS